MIDKKNVESVLKKHTNKLLEKGFLQGVFPCGAAGISMGTGKEKKTIITNYGKAALYPEEREVHKNTYFDLASLTKPLATTMAILCLVKMKKIDVDEELPSLLEKKLKGENKKITLKQLLGHNSGLPAHRDYFKVLKGVPDIENGEIVENLLLREESEHPPGTTVVYSDLGFMLLGRIIEKKSGYPLEQFVQKKVLQPLNLEQNIFYNVLPNSNSRPREAFAATETCPWRKKTLCGEVHDDNCYAMGGVAGHSGLFGNIESVTTLAGFILDMWKGVASHPNIKNKDLVSFLVRQNEASANGRALGFDTTTKGDSSSGKFFSAKSVGHLGFTGTSFWIDPEKDIVVVLLSNRVHPNRENTKIKVFRPFFHDMVLGKILTN